MKRSHRGNKLGLFAVKTVYNDEMSSSMVVSLLVDDNLRLKKRD